eukprot:748205-Rhodomonas_salina.1
MSATDLHCTALLLTGCTRTKSTSDVLAGTELRYCATHQEYQKAFTYLTKKLKPFEKQRSHPEEFKD